MRGQNARSGPGSRPGFEGGQTPMYRRFPKLKGIAGGEYFTCTPSFTRARHKPKPFWQNLKKNEDFCDFVVACLARRVARRAVHHTSAVPCVIHITNHALVWAREIR